MKKIIVTAFVVAFVVTGCRLATTPTPQPQVNPNTSAQNQNQSDNTNTPAQPEGAPVQNQNSNADVVAPGEEQPAACKDVCGNGVCEEIVCLALGCPCAESRESCPQDCA